MYSQVKKDNLNRSPQLVHKTAESLQKKRKNQQLVNFSDNREHTKQLKLNQLIINKNSVPDSLNTLPGYSEKPVQREVELGFDDKEADDFDEHEYNTSGEAKWPVKGDLKGKAESDYESAISGKEELRTIYYQSEDTTQNKIARQLKVIQRLTAEKLVNTKNYGTANYQYDYDGAGNIDNFSNNRATTLPVGANPVIAPVVDLGDGVVAAGKGQMRSGKIVDIVSSSRSRHFSIADRIIDGTPADRKGKYTWHHLTPEYKMVRVDMNVHLGSRGGFPHTGGKSFWT